MDRNDAHQQTLELVMPEIVYILTNEAMPGLIKIGHTKSDLAARVRYLSSATGVPLGFTVFYAAEVKDSAEVEDLMHSAFTPHRINPKREFFRLAPEHARAALMIGAIREVGVGDEQFETPQDRDEVKKAAARRPPIRFSDVGIPADSLLTLKWKNYSGVIQARVIDDRTLSFDGKVMSVPEATKAALRRAGYTGDTIYSPYGYWTFEEELIDARRVRLEEEAEADEPPRRGPLRFSMLGIKPGTVLTLDRNPQVTCTTVDDGNQVIFNGQQMALSTAALEAVRATGADWPSASGAYIWTLNGDRLRDLREQMEG